MDVEGLQSATLTIQWFSYTCKAQSSSQHSLWALLPSALLRLLWQMTSTVQLLHSRSSQPFEGMVAPSIDVGLDDVSKATVSYSNSIGNADSFSVGALTNIGANASASSTPDYNVTSSASFSINASTVNQVIGTSAALPSALTDIMVHSARPTRLTPLTMTSPCLVSVLMQPSQLPQPPLLLTSARLLKLQVQRMTS